MLTPDLVQAPQKSIGDYLPQGVTYSLANYIRSCYENAKQAKQQITERLLRCERQRRGEYDPHILAQIKEGGGSEVYLMLTDIKCRAAEAWIKDVMMSAGESPWSVESTVKPSLPVEVSEQIIEQITAQATAAIEQGQNVTPEQVTQFSAQMHQQALQQLQKAAETAAEAMSDTILDHLQENDWDNTLSDIIYDFVTFPTCYIKGPVVRNGKKMKWGNNWTPVVTTERTLNFERVSPYDAFPSPAATSTQDGFFIERHRFFRADLHEMKGVPGFSDEQIDLALDRYGQNGLREITFGETERDYLSGRNTLTNRNEIIEGIEFWGSASGAMLIEWGMDGVDPHTDYQISAIQIGDYVVKAVINPDPLGRRPYSNGSFIRIPGAIWGQALPESMADVQTICNGSARAIHNNMGVASGPQVEVTIDRLPDGEDVSQVYPYKVWQTTSDRTGGGQPAIRFFQPNMNAEPLLNVLQYFSRIADEVTGVPNYIYGSNQASGAGRTASGLSMLMDNAAKGIKQAILNLDRGTREMLKRTYYYLMVYDPDQSIKGDMQVVPAGVVRALIKDHLNEKRASFLQMTSNPVDMQIMGTEGRAELVRQIGAGMQLEMDGIIPSKDQIAQMQGGIPPEVQQQMQEMQTMVQQLQQQLSDKNAELEIKRAELDLKREEIAANLEEVRIAGQSQVSARMHESELKAKTDAEATLAKAQLERETKLEIAQMAEETKRITASQVEETKKHIATTQNTAVAKGGEEKTEKDVDPTKAIAEIVKAIASQPAPVINVQVDAKTGETKKSITVKRDKDGNITGAEVKE